MQTPHALTRRSGAKPHSFQGLHVQRPLQFFLTDGRLRRRRAGYVP